MFTRLSTSWPSSPPMVRWGAIEAIGCWIGVELAASLWAGLLEGVGADSATGPLWLRLVAAAGLWLGFFTGPSLISRRMGQGPGIDFSMKLTAREAVVAATIGVAVQLVLLPPLYWLVLKFLTGDPGEAARDLTNQVNNVVDAALLILAVVVVAPVAEERMYRGMLLAGLTRPVGPWVAILLSSGLFAIAHGAVILIPGLMVLGMILAWMTASSGRVGPAVITHMAFNATTVAQLLVF